MYLDPQPSTPPPNPNTTAASILRTRISGVEDWLADFTARTTGFPVPDFVGDGRPFDSSAHRRVLDQQDAEAEPRVYSSIGDYLTHMGSISERRRRELSEEKEREDATRQKTFVNQHSRQLVERMRMRRIVELYDLLDWQGVGFIDLTNLDDKMHALSPDEQAFLRPILERHAAVEASMDMETFVSLMTAAMNESTTGPLTALASSRSSARFTQKARDLDQTRKSNLEYTNNMSHNSERMAEQQQQRRDMGDSQRQQRWQYLSNERAMWGQRREALERKKEAEEMAQCTFTPKINKGKTAEGGARKLNKYHFMSPIRVTNNVLSSEERELLEHCTFSPNRNVGKAESRGTKWKN